MPVVILLLLGKVFVMALDGLFHGVGVVALILHACKLVALVEKRLAQGNSRLR